MMSFSISLPIMEQVQILTLYDLLWKLIFYITTRRCHIQLDYSKRDKNGLNPLELSMKKNQLKAEW